MKIALFLHAYQPPTQFPEMTKLIFQESYLPIVEILSGIPRAKVTLNLVASLLEQLEEKDRSKLVGEINKLIASHNIELTATAAYHPLLTRIPDDEIIRQIKLNQQITKSVLGKDTEFAPKGVFLPEMFYTKRVAEVIDRQLDHEWILLDESAFPEAGVNEEGQHFKLEIGSHVYRIDGTGLNVFFRNRPLSLDMAFNGDLTVDLLVEKLKEHFLVAQESYAVIAIDAETFGHHHKNNLKLLRDFMLHPYIEPVFVSDILSFGYTHKEVEPLDSTWGAAMEDIEHHRTFPRWDNPDNPVHKLQWELFNLALSVGEHKGSTADEFDKALHSDQFWWGSHNPCWHPEMLRRGAQSLVKVISQSSKATNDVKATSIKIAEDIEVVGREVFGETVVGC